MPIKQETVEKKLNDIVDIGAPKTFTYKGNKHYISKKKIKEIREQQKEGGIFPLIPIFIRNRSSCFSRRSNSRNS